ncbi:MAG: PLP-dependent aminotransferase family protein [Ruminococcaceae bacterium]|nr:PLP-dependent aminotransferase family protein [Oscillospiraceae bacterium]
MLLDFANLDFKENGNFYNNIYQKIRDAVYQGAIKSGEKLPSIREAAKLLGVSRTTIENAYTRLCIEGIAESFPQKGYFITNYKKVYLKNQNSPDQSAEIIFDFSSRKIDTAAADTELWKKIIRSVLHDSGELTSYGDSQGEIGLREALATYSYKARGVKTSAENIIIGAGISPLLSILCSITEKNISVGFENESFKKAEAIFSDYRVNSRLLPSDANGVITNKIENDINAVFLQPSSLSKFSVNTLAKRRNELMTWANGKSERFVIEDDYNGELRYTARTVPAFQGKFPEKTVYIGSFSKLLLPSVRIAYMVLPPFLTERFRKRYGDYNQTCGKIEQLALMEYIKSGALEKHLRRLRRLYYSKSQLLYNSLKENLSCFKSATLYESSLILELKTNIAAESEEICKAALKSKIRVMPTNKKGAIRLCFAGIKTEEIDSAVKCLENCLKNSFSIEKCKSL